MARSVAGRTGRRSPMTRRAPSDGAAWDLTALLNSAAHAAQPKSALAERHLWLIRLLEWLRHAPAPRHDDAFEAAAAEPLPGTATPRPLLRLRHLLNVLDRHAEHRAAVATLIARFWQEVDTPALFADFGFSPRPHFFGELAHRLKRKFLPSTPATTDLGELFGLLFPHDDDALWLDAIDAPTLDRLVALLRGGLPAGAAATPAGLAASPPPVADWRTPLYDAIMYLASHVRAAGFSVLLRQRMSAERRAEQPFRQLSQVVEQLRAQALAGDQRALLREAQYLRALLDSCRRSAASVLDHLEDNGVSINIVFEVDQLRERTHRIEQLLNCVLSAPDAAARRATDAPRQPAIEVTRLLAELVRVAAARRSIRALFASHYSLLARKVAQRSAATGEHYITRDRSEYAAMLRAAAGGGVVIAGTTFMKFALLALGLSAFWGGFWAGVNYAVSFLIVHLLHWTVATKQPAMTAPAMAEKLNDVGAAAAGGRDGDGDADGGDVGEAARISARQREVVERRAGSERRAERAAAGPPGADDAAAVERFVDEVANLIRSQAAGIFGNLGAVIPVVLAVQWAAQAAFGAPPIGLPDAVHIVDSLSRFGPTVLFAAFTGVLLFTSSIIAGWVENWFVWHRLDSAIAWNPRIVARLGQARAQRWARWWRLNISGLASNVSLGLLLGIVPVVARFFGLPLDVRHVTLSTGQLTAAVGAQGFGLLAQAPFWWCVLGIAATGTLNLGVSFFLAFKVALRSRGVRLADRSRIYRAIRRRLRLRPASFILPPRTAPAAMPSATNL